MTQSSTNGERRATGIEIEVAPPTERRFCRPDECLQGEWTWSSRCGKVIRTDGRSEGPADAGERALLDGFDELVDEWDGR